MNEQKHRADLPLLLLVTGLPGTGKSTLARRLAPALGLPLIARDDLKESLFETLGWSTVEWSQKLGRATYALVYLLMERLLAARCSLLVETLFDPAFANARFQQLQQRTPFQPVQVQLSTRPDVLVQRYAQRVDSGERHPGHVDRLRMGDFDPEALAQRNRPLDIGGALIAIDTTDFAALDFDGLVAQIDALRRGPPQRPGQRESAGE